MDPKAMQMLTMIGGKTSLRYALQMVTSAHLLAKRRKSPLTDVVDVRRSYDLFVDAGRSRQFLDEYQLAFALDVPDKDPEGDVLMRDAAAQ